MTAGDPFSLVRGEQPLLAVAVHAGHEVRDEVAALLAVSASDRLREEDPFTDRWLPIALNQIAVHRSRFEVDLNRPRAGAVYGTPQEAWGLQVWAARPAAHVLARSLEVYDAFYDELGRICDALSERYARFVVLDLHSYNHRRGGPDAPADDPDRNPEVNVGTGSMDRERWADVVEGFMAGVAAAPFDHGHLDVRENVRFRGGHLARWVHRRYPTAGCCLAVEVKKFFMDEWSGHPDHDAVEDVNDALRAGVAEVLSVLL